MMKQISRLIALAFPCLFIIQSLNAESLPEIKIGVLQFGTVNWELDVIREHKLDEAQGVRIIPVKLGNKNATSIALQGGEVDMIVSDWIWVSRQRAGGKSYVFFPYSNAVGGLVVNPDSGIRSLADLKGKKLGIAGGPVDKSWLLYRAYVQKQHGFDLADEVDAKFAAPPLLNKLMLKGELDAAITFWKFGAQLKAAGMQPMPSVPEILPEFGVDTSMPLLGWVYDGVWGEKNRHLVSAVLKASYDAKSLLKESDTEWKRLSSLVKPKNEKELISVRDTFRAGIPDRFGEEEIAGAAKIYRLLAQTGGKKLVGDSMQLDTGTFWQEFSISP